MTIREIMTPSPYTATPDTSLPEAVELMRKGGFRRLPVVSGGQVVGMVTDRDLKEAKPSSATSLSVWELNYLVARVKIGEIMAQPVIEVRPTATLEEAAGLLLHHKIGGLPVTENGHLLGIVTITDVLAALVGNSQKQLVG